MEARTHQGDVEDQGLNGDARRRRGPDQSDTARIPDARILTGRVVPVDVQVGHDRGDRDDVVENRGPHIRPEARSRIENLPP